MEDNKHMKEEGSTIHFQIISVKARSFCEGNRMREGRRDDGTSLLLGHSCSTL
jgi:hypothetical protein